MIISAPVTSAGGDSRGDGGTADGPGTSTSAAKEEGRGGNTGGAGSVDGAHAGVLVVSSLVASFTTAAGASDDEDEDDDATRPSSPRSGDIARCGGAPLPIHSALRTTRPRL